MTKERFTGSNGDLYLLNPRPAPFPAAPVRVRYEYQYHDIKSGAEFRATLRAGPYAWPGGYELAFVTSDGAAICFGCARQEVRNITRSVRYRLRDGWRVVGTVCEAESDEMCSCDHCGREIWPGAEDGDAP